MYKLKNLNCNLWIYVILELCEELEIFPENLDNYLTVILLYPECLIELCSRWWFLGILINHFLHKMNKRIIMLRGGFSKWTLLLFPLYFLTMSNGWCVQLKRTIEISWIVGFFGKLIWRILGLDCRCLLKLVKFLFILIIRGVLTNLKTKFNFFDFAFLET